MSSLVSTTSSSNAAVVSSKSTTSSNAAVVCLDYDGCTDILFLPIMNYYDYYMLHYPMYANKLAMARQKLITWLANIADTHDKVYITCGSNRQSKIIDSTLAKEKWGKSTNILKVDEEHYHAFNNLEKLEELLKHDRIENVARQLIKKKDLNIEPLNNKIQRWELVKLLLPDANYENPTPDELCKINENKKETWFKYLTIKKQQYNIKRIINEQRQCIIKEADEDRKETMIKSIGTHMEQIRKLSSELDAIYKDVSYVSLIKNKTPKVGTDWAETIGGNDITRLRTEQMHWKIDIVLNNLNYFRDQGVTDFYFIDDDTYTHHKPLNGFIMAQKAVLEKTKDIYCDVHLCKFDWYAMCGLDKKVKHHHDIEELYHKRRESEGYKFQDHSDEKENITLIF